MKLVISIVLASIIISNTAKANADSDERYKMTPSTITTERAVTKIKANHAVADANGNLGVGIVRSSKTGATARVGAAYVAKFQAYIDALERVGATIYSLGGNRDGRCSSRHMHNCGMAIDVCQTGRDRVMAKCNLPSRSELIRIANAHGLFEGGAWCNGDMGHAQVGVSAVACGSATRSRQARMVMP